ncbi:MAG: hypothetical protein R3D26_02110 [Cyanobacteriota/Melainabacteria group bacterium]
MRTLCAALALGHQSGPATESIKFMPFFRQGTNRSALGDPDHRVSLIFDIGNGYG